MSRMKPVMPILCCVLLAAHFLREQSPGLLVTSLAPIPLIFIRCRWALLGLRIFFALAAIEWVHTAAVFAAERAAMGIPWMRMVLILGVVAVMSLGSAWTVAGGSPHPPAGR